MPLTNEKILHVLTGPTAVGKTELALRWAETHDAEIISCDSLLFYRGMDIGTAKPSPAELARVPHHLIDIHPCDEQMDISRYIALARDAADAITARGKRILVTGGSGFYLKAFFAPVVDDIAVPPALRSEIAAQLASAGLPSLVVQLRALNPAGLGALDTENPRRVTRALERCRASNRTLAELAADFARRPGAFDGWQTKITVLDRARDELDTRITRRVAAMLAAGLIDEVRRLRALGFEKNTSASSAIGYRETLAMLDGKLPPEKLAAEITQNTRALVKKQRTWFRAQLPAHETITLQEKNVRTCF